MKATAWVGLLICACATRSARRETSPTQTIVMEPLRIEVVRRGDVFESRIVDAEALFDEAGLAISTHEFKQAVALCDRLLNEFPDSRLIASTMYNAGLAHEGLGDWSGAVERYRALVEKFPGTTDALDAEFRLGGAYAEMRNFSASVEAFAHISQLPSLSLSDRVEALARLGYARFELGDHEGARSAVERAIAEHARNELYERLDSRFFLAMAHYYLAQLHHTHFRAAPIRLPEEQMAKDLDEKARLLLDAHAAYIESIRAKDPTWATAAGYQLGQLYREFREALLDAPVPEQLDAEARAAYLDMLRKHDKVRLLLEKALSVYEKTLLMAERVGVRNDWVERARREVETVRNLLRGHGDEGDVPGSREQIPAAPKPELRPELGEDPPPSFVL